MTLRYLSATNGFVPQATGQVISFIRDPKSFPLNKYVQYIQSPATVGLYAKIDRDQPARNVSDADYVWADGGDMPQGHANQLRFEWVEFACKRRAYSFTIGNIALEQAKGTWKPLEQHSGMTAQQAMTNRVNRVITLGETASNWNGNTDTATSLNGGAGRWDTASDDPSSGAYNAIKKSLMKAAEKVNLATNALVQPKDLVLVISPGLAQAIGNSGEIHNYLKYGPFSKAELEGPNNSNQNWGLPPSLYGFELIVDDTVRVSTRPGATETSSAQTGTRAYAKGDTSAILCSRKGGINGLYGAPNFSTFQLYFHKYELAVYTFDDPQNMRTKGAVVEMFAEVLAAPETGFYITGVL